MPSGANSVWAGRSSNGFNVRSHLTLAAGKRRFAFGPFSASSQLARQHGSPVVEKYSSIGIDCSICIYKGFFSIDLGDGELLTFRLLRLLPNPLEQIGIPLLTDV